MAIVPVAEGGAFEMGSPDSEQGRDSDERLHRAVLDHRFAIATREVTAAQFARCLAANPGAGPVAAEPSPSSSCPDCPVVGVDWLAAAGYCNWLSQREGLHPYYEIRDRALSVSDRDGVGYRLPSECEWEFACRAGARTSRPYGASEALLGNFAWFLPNASMHVQPVGRLKPNDFGLFDILGNAFEWTEDRYLRHSIATAVRPAAEEEDPGKSRDELEVVLRGGCSSSPATLLRSAYRERCLPSNPLGTYGFRYVRTLPPTRAGDNQDQ
jgi:formylglycine-generating enzyme required for sulfatase activity